MTHRCRIGASAAVLLRRHAGDPGDELVGAFGLGARARERPVSAPSQGGEETRAEALRGAMLSLIDGDGFKDAAGRTVFPYAHPLFWAPYSIIGDGG
jgi:hypothetical protein